MHAIDELHDGIAFVRNMLLDEELSEEKLRDYQDKVAATNHMLSPWLSAFSLAMFGTDEYHKLLDGSGNELLGEARKTRQPWQF